MTYFVHANDGNGTRRVGHFLAGSDKEAQRFFKSEFKNNGEYDVDGLDLYRIDDKEPVRRHLVEYRWRLVTAPRDLGDLHLPINLANPPVLAE